MDDTVTVNIGVGMDFMASDQDHQSESKKSRWIPWPQYFVALSMALQSPASPWTDKARWPGEQAGHAGIGVMFLLAASGKNIQKKTWLLFPYYVEIGEDLELHVLKDIVYIVNIS